MIITIRLDGLHAELMQQFVEDCGAPSAAILVQSIIKDILDDEYGQEVADDNQAA